MRWSLFGRWRRPQERRREATPQELLQDALAQLHERQQVAKKHKVKGRRHHTDEYRELVVDGAKNINMPEALLDLTRDALANRERSAEEGQRTQLPSRRGPITDEASRLEAERAAKEMGDEMKRHGMTPGAHYYTTSERVQTGEIDRTYLVEDKKKRPGRPNRKT